MDIVVTCSQCKSELQLSPEAYQSDCVDRWSVEPHVCNAAEQSVRRTALPVRILNTICYGTTIATFLWLLFGSR